jgi:protein-S-isoprenylcysteine O-methyltransferase Ste14
VVGLERLDAQRWGRLLVAAQMLLIGLMAALAVPALVQGRVSALAGLLLGLGAALGLWALWANRPGNFNIVPQPRAGARLVTHGPYRWARHPMYTAVLLFCAGLVAVSASIWAGLGWIVLVTVLARKAAMEEALITQAHPDYAAYAARTRRFLPWVV